MHLVISYDVTEDRARTRIAKLLVEVMTRVQYSVFEGELSEKELASVVDRALVHLDPELDSLRVYRLCAACEKKVTQYGRDVDLKEKPVVVL